MEADYQGFSIREYTLHIRNVELRKCWPFPGEITEDLINSFLPPITVAKFRWWSHELASLLTKSPVMPEAAFQRKGKIKSTPCKKRPITDEGEDSDVLIGSKRKKTKDLVVQKLKERSSGVRCLSYTEEELFPDCDSEFQNIDASQCERHVRFSDQSGKLSPLLETKIVSLELCCSELNRLSLLSDEDQSLVNDEITKVISNDNQTSDNMMLESRQLNKFQPVVSERRSPHFSLERIKDALDLERKRHVAQPIQSFISTSNESQYTRCSSSSSQPASADMHYRTLLNQSPCDPLLVEWMQESVLHRQGHMEETISGFPLNLQGQLVKPNGEGCLSFDRSGLGTGSSTPAAGHDLLLSDVVDLSSGKKHFTEPVFVKDGVDRVPVVNEKRYKYFPARLGLDETFTEKGFFISDTNDGVSASHTINNEPKQDTLSQNLGSRNMAANRDGLCLHNSQSTMRLMGKDVSVGTSYSDLVRRGERIIAPDGSVDCSFLGSYTHQSCWLWRMNTLGISDNHSKFPLPRCCEPHVELAPQARTAVVPDSYFPPTFLYPFGSLAASPLTSNDLHGSSLWQQLNSVTFSQQQLHFPSTPDTTCLPSGYSNVGIGLFPDAREASFGFPFSFKDSASQSQLHWPQSYFESSRSDMSFINPVGDQLASLYGSNSSPYTNVGEANKWLAYLEEYPMKSQRIPMFPMQGGLNHEKEFFCRPGN